MFRELLGSGNPEVSVLAALLLSHIHVEEEGCVTRLTAVALGHSSPHYQSPVGITVGQWSVYEIAVHVNVWQ